MWFRDSDENFSVIPLILEIFLIFTFSYLISPSFLTHALFLPFLWDCFLSLSLSRRMPPGVLLWRRSSHGLAHTRRHPPPSFLSIPSPYRALCLLRALFILLFSQARALSRYLLDVPVNTAGAVTVMYGCNPSSAVWHGCQLPRETRWFIFCGAAYGLI